MYRVEMSKDPGALRKLERLYRGANGTNPAEMKQVYS
jgi:hypothetical protein